MSLITFNRDRFPWASNGNASWLNTDGFFADDLFTKESNLPAMNVKENNENFELELAVPGFSKEDIAITMDNDVLSISGKHESKDENEEDGYTRKDFSYSSFERKIQLPQGVDSSENIKAIYKDGILKLELHKKQEAIAQPKRTIAIQ